METIELFSGTKSFSKVMANKGHKTFTVDFDERLNPDLCKNMLDFDWNLHYPGPNRVDVFWASPPCTAFSVASISRHWTGGSCAYIPKSDSARLGLKLLEKTIIELKKSNPKYWFIENPRGVMRKVIDDIFKRHNIYTYRRVTVWYCQYGDIRAKPTDIWTNLPDWNGKQCHNYRKGKEKHCNHEEAPRGSKTGTQGLKDAIERGVIPPKLFEEILEYMKP